MDCGENSSKEDDIGLDQNPHKTILDAIKKDNCDELISALRVDDAFDKEEDIEYALKWACIYGKYLLENGYADLFGQYEYGNNPLHWVAYNGADDVNCNLEVAEYLINYADEYEDGVKDLLGAVNLFKNTPLHIAATFCVGDWTDIIHLYLTHGANPCMKDRFSARPHRLVPSDSQARQILKHAVKRWKNYVEPTNKRIK